jgi:hypothetical protein
MVSVVAALVSVMAAAGSQHPQDQFHRTLQPLTELTMQKPLSSWIGLLSFLLNFEILIPYYRYKSTNPQSCQKLVSKEDVSTLPGPRVVIETDAGRIGLLRPLFATQRSV